MLKYGTSIPLFPLNVVLFPGMMLPLHIFEDRYKTMIKDCMANDEIFGVVLAKNNSAQQPNVSGLYLDDIYTIGTTARITAVERLENERLNLITVGQERFLIKSIEAGLEDVLIGQVDPLPMYEKHNSTEINNLTTKLKPLVERYINHLATASGEDISNATLPTDPAALAYLGAMAVQGPLPDKQQLLATNSLRALIAKTVSVLDRENQILAYMIKAHQAHQQVERLPFVDYSLN